MPTYLYCLLTTRADGASPIRPGVDGAPVRVLNEGPIGAWASTIGSGVPAPTPENARAHDAVVREAMAAETPLPARFGQAFDSDGALRAAMHERSDQLLAALDRVRGMCEMTVRVMLDDAARTPPAEPGAALSSSHATPDRAAPDVAAQVEPRRGRAYLAQVRAREHAAATVQQEADFLQERVNRAVVDFVRDVTRQDRSALAHSLTLSHLIAREAVPGYRLALRTLQQREPALRLMLSGPWAPYSFADGARV